MNKSCTTVFTAEFFVSWKEFLKDLNSQEKIQAKSLEASPIPPGYFNGLDAKITSISGEETIKEHFENKLYRESDLIEMLYCKNGCNNGDGVLINE